MSFSSLRAVGRCVRQQMCLLQRWVTGVLLPWASAPTGDGSVQAGQDDAAISLCSPHAALRNFTLGLGGGKGGLV